MSDGFFGFSGPLSVPVPYINIQDQKTVNTEGGAFTSGAWRTRDLTTIVSDIYGIASLSSNQITLPPGTYYARILCPAHAVNTNQGRLQNITDGTTLLLGTSSRDGAGADYGTTPAFVVGAFTLTDRKVLEVQHQCGTTKTVDGFGVHCGFGTEVYTIAEFWKEDLVRRDA